MLVLKRNILQQIKIGPDITIVVLEASHGTVKIGIDAPKQVAITRPEARRQTPRKIA